MITALHALLYSEDPPATRAFFRECRWHTGAVSKTYTSAMSTETSMSDSFASVKITPLTGGTSP
jgi:hypothetical protein